MAKSWIKLVGLLVGILIAGCGNEENRFRGSLGKVNAPTPGPARAAEAPAAPAAPATPEAPATPMDAPAPGVDASEPATPPTP